MKKKNKKSFDLKFCFHCYVFHFSIIAFYQVESFAWLFIVQTYSAAILISSLSEWNFIILIWFLIAILFSTI